MVIGLGSIGKRHYSLLNKIEKVKKIYVLTKQKGFKNKITDIKEIIRIKPTHIIISNETNKHFYYVKFIEKNLINCNILIEKPIFNKLEIFKPIKNNYFIGYNLRFNPIIDSIKKLIHNEKIISINIFCGSYLPKWRNNDYTKSYSASKKLGGGVLLDLSHEIDYLIYLFGNLKLLFTKINKLSNLKINVEDNAIIIGKTKTNSIVNITLNYFTKIPHRFLIIDSNNLTIKADLIKNKLEYKKNSRSFFKKFNFEKNHTYNKQLISFLTDKKKLCSFSEAYEVLKIISKIKNK